jgi:hypothetical protein
MDAATNFVSYVPTEDLCWHYTSLYTLLNILRSDCLHLSSYRFLNDPAEGQSARPLVEAAWNEALRDGKSRVSLEGLRRNLSSIPPLDYPGTEQVDTFAFSFSRHRDLLSQWSRYGDNGQGVALGFRLIPNQLAQFSPKDGWTYGPFLSEVTYWEARHGESANPNTLSERLVNALQKLLVDAEDHEELENDLLTVSEILAPSVKSHGYREEAEVRCWIRTDASATTIVDFKTNQRGIVPFVALPLRDSGLALTEIMLGPRLSGENSVSVNWMKQKFHLDEGSISLSELAYR